MRLLKTPTIKIFSLLFIIVWAGMRINFHSYEDSNRESRYERSADSVMTIGLVWSEPATAVEKSYSFERGAKQALDEFTRSGRLKGICKRIRVQMISESGKQVDQLDGELGQALDDPSLVALLGFITSIDAHRAAILSAKRNVFILSTLATWPSLTKHGFDNLFRIVPSDKETALLLARFCKSRGYKKVGIINSMMLHGNALSPLLSEGLLKQKIEVAFSHAYPPDHEPTFPKVLDIIGPLLVQHNDLDALFVIDDMNVNAKLLKLLRRAGVSIPILGSDSFDFPGIWDEAGSAAEGLCFVSSWPTRGSREKVANLYRQTVPASERSKVSMQDFVHCGFVQGYETMSVYLSSVVRAGSFYPKHLGVVLRNQAVDTLYGRVRFTSDGDVLGRDLVVNEIVHGHPEEVFPEPKR